MSKLYITNFTIPDEQTIFNDGLTYRHDPYQTSRTFFWSPTDLERNILSSYGLDSDAKIQRLDHHLKHALMSEDLQSARKILEIALKFISVNPMLHKPTIYTLKYGALTIHKTIEQLSPELDIAPIMHLLFCPFYDFVLKNVNMEYLPPDIEFIVIDILNNAHVAYVMKYLATTPHKFIHINSFKHMLQSLMDPDVGNQYLGIITTLIHLFINEQYQWLLWYISNDLLWYTMQQDLELALKLLKASMDYDISYRNRHAHLQLKSFIDFHLIEATFKVIKHYDPHGLNHKQSCLKVQQTLIRNYSPDLFDPIPSQQDVQDLFTTIMTVNVQYQSFHDLVVFFRFQKLKDQWGVHPDPVLRRIYLDAAIKFCALATENSLKQWV